MKKLLLSFTLFFIGWSFTAMAQSPIADTDQWALIRLSVGGMRAKGAHSAEQVSQTVMGMPVKLLGYSDGWWEAESPDGYKGWINAGAIEKKTDAEMKAWRQAPRLVVTSNFEFPAYAYPEAFSSREIVTDLVPGCIVEGTLDNVVSGRVEITLPDGRKAWARAEWLTPIEAWADQEFNPDAILDQAYSLEGSPYLWGGTSTKGVDCSGLVRVSYYANGYILMRDASQQARTGTKLAAEDWPSYEAGDLMFFGNNATGKVTHVAIYDHDGWFVHSSGRVKRNHLDPTHPMAYDRKIIHSVRIHGNEGTSGITKVINHPWYF